jgi:hypothetical protein
MKKNRQIAVLGLSALTLIGLLTLGRAAEARYGIKAPRPGGGDFLRALHASRAVNREVPMGLSASTAPRARTLVRNGVIHERATVIANVNYDTFIKRLDPANWSKNLPQRWGGEVSRLRDGRGTLGRGTVLQQERMVLGLPALDMTKNTVVRVGKDRSRIQWQVTHSDRTALTLGRKTVLMDNGWIEFSRTRDNRVQITTRSAHKISTTPSHWLGKIAPRTTERLMAASLRSYFKNTVKRYKDIGEGRRAAR